MDYISERIFNFLKETFEKTHKKSAVIGLSGGVDSATSFYLLSKALKPENIFVAHLFYFQPMTSLLEPMLKEKKILEQNISILSIRQSVDAIAEALRISPGDKVRLGNIAARVRMIFLFDLARKTDSLVCGTENKSENLLGYFTRFGDQASDIEPISHLYKTEVYKLAEHLGVPKEIIRQKPTAGLWEGQTDEGEFGFTYAEADQVLHLYFDKHLEVDEIERSGLSNARKIVELCNKNEFKHKVPYHLEEE